MIPENRTTIASLVVGLVGAVIGGFESYAMTVNVRDPDDLYIILPAGIISGFLSCFFISKWYLKLVEYKTWKWWILFGPLFGGFAGVISAAITSICYGFAVMNVNASIGALLGQFLFAGVVGLVIGCLSGVGVGLLSSLMFGAIRAIFARKRG